MSKIKDLIDIFLHIDKHLVDLTNNMGNWTYVILFLIVFMETGLVVTPFLPGDSLLFAAGAICALGSMNIWVLYVLMCVAAIVGDSVNYSIGNYIGPKAFKGNNRFLNKEYLLKAEKFYEKYGGKAIVLARFVPIVRTFAPFVAGVGTMEYKRFLIFNIVGGITWVSIFLLGGYYFGNIQFIKDNFHYTVVIIILISIVPVIYEIWNSRKSKQSNNKSNIYQAK